MLSMTYKLQNLQLFHLGMKKLGVHIATFDFTYKNIVYSCLFEANYEEGFSLSFFKQITGDSLKIPILPSYLVNTYIEDRELFTDFWNFFQLQAKDGGFTMESFFERLNKSIPSKFEINKNLNRPLISKKYVTEDKERPYFLGFINWQTLRAKNPEVRGSRSETNLEKTKILYPQIYQAIKDYDISVRYTDIANPNAIEFENLLNNSFYND